MSFGTMHVAVLLSVVISLAQACTPEEGDNSVDIAKIAGEYYVVEISEGAAGYTYCDVTYIVFDESSHTIKIHGVYYDSGVKKPIVYIVHLGHNEDKSSEFTQKFTMDEEATTTWEKSSSRRLMYFDGTYLVFKMCSDDSEDTDAVEIMWLRSGGKRNDEKEVELMAKFGGDNTAFHGSEPLGGKCPGYWDK